MRAAWTVALRGATAAWALGLACAAWAGDARIVALDDGTTVPVAVFPAHGNALLLWLPSETGFGPVQKDAAVRLARRGLEVWLADTLSARFLPSLPSSLEQIPAADIAQLIAAARRDQGKSVYLMAAGRGAVPALRGAARWRERHGATLAGSGLAGAILLYPNLYTATPEPGQNARYLPIASRTQLDIVILQGKLSPWYWRLDTLKSRLERGGSRVKINTLPGTRDRFYARDATIIPLPSEQAMAARLPELLFNAWKELQAMPGGTP